VSGLHDQTISDASRTLVSLLRKELHGVAVNLAPPKDAGSGTRLTLFLYKVIQNAELKNDGRRFLPPDGSGRHMEQEAPLTVDLHYLLTAHATDLFDAHQALSGAMRVLYDNAVLRGSRLVSPDSRGLTDDSVLRITLDPLSTEEMNRIWSLFPDTPYEISVAYLVTPVPIESGRTESTAPVVDQLHDQGQLEPAGASREA
jgi:hypothetical protein